MDIIVFFAQSSIEEALKNVVESSLALFSHFDEVLESQPPWERQMAMGQNPNCAPQ